MKTPEQIAREATAGTKFMGGLLMAVGLLIGGSAGLCTLVFEGSLLASLLKGTSLTAATAQMLLLPIVFGGLPILLGVGLFAIGLGMFRSTRRRPPPSAKV